MLLTAVYRDAAGGIRVLRDEREIASAAADRDGLTWLNISETGEADAALLGRVFGFHPLALQDCLNGRYQRPKVDDYRDHLFLMLHGVDHVATEELVATTELDLFVGPNFVVSAHLVPMPAVDALAEQAAAGEGRHLERGAAMLAHALIDALVDSVLPTVDRMGEVADAIEEEALERPERELLQAILRLKRSALRIGRVMGPQRDLLGRISRGEYALLPAESSIYFRDVYDHVARIEDLTQTLRERADYAMTTYLSAVSIRQNESMRVLSIVASIFLPLTLLAGIYGMNFEYMPELTWRWGYFAVLGVMLAVSGSVLWWFWARRWIGAGRQQIARALDFKVEPRVLGEVIGEAARLRTHILDATSRASTAIGRGRAEDEAQPK